MKLKYAIFSNSKVTKIKCSAFFGTPSIAHQYPKMNDFDTMNFSECWSKEVMFLLTLIEHTHNVDGDCFNYGLLQLLVCGVARVVDAGAVRRHFDDELLRRNGSAVGSEDHLVRVGGDFSSSRDPRDGGLGVASGCRGIRKAIFKAAASLFKPEVRLCAK